MVRSHHSAVAVGAGGRQIKEELESGATQCANVPTEQHANVDETHQLMQATVANIGVLLRCSDKIIEM
jgi:hypothetical protein